MKKADQKLYNEWLETQHFSGDYYKMKEDQWNYQNNVKKFFASDQPIGDPFAHKTKQKPTAEMIKYFKMNTTASKPFSLEVGNQVSNGGGSYETTNQQFRRLYELDSKNQEMAKQHSEDMKFDIPPINTSGREGNEIWKSKKYQDPEFRQDLTKTTNSQNLNYDAEIAQLLRTSKHNIKKTPISEFSNASHNGTVFVNPKFSSC